MISIIIPLYNQADKIGACLDSIYNQTIENYEIIVINDRSTDRLSRVIAKYKEKFGVKIDFYHSQIHHGAPHARNRGFHYSKGEYVLFCDADAYLEHDALERMLDTLRLHKEASYVYPNHKWGWKKIRLFPFDAEKLREMPYIHTMALLRREHLPKNGWDENIKKLQDWDLWLTMLEDGHIGFWLDEYLFHIKPGGIYSSWLPSFAYKLLPFLPSVIRYNKAVRVIKEKHGLL